MFKKLMRDAAALPRMFPGVYHFTKAKMIT
jgi:hypothetical protein